MIKTLRKRFIRIAMLAVGAVMLLIIAALAVGIHTSTRAQLVSTLDMLAVNRGSLPSENDWVPPEPPDSDQDKNDGNNNKKDDKRRRIPDGRGGEMSPEIRFLTRFFVIKYDADGTMTDSDWSNIAAVDERYAGIYLAKAIENGEGIGLTDTYIFKVTKTDEGYMAIFLDCERERTDAIRLCVTAVIVAAGCTALVYSLIFFFSKRAIKPVIENIERQKQFVTDVSHELKTPLTVIATSQRVLEMDTGKNKWIDKTLDQVDNMRGLVDEMVTLSRLDEERRDIFYDTFDASEAMKETAESFRDFAEANGHRLILDSEPEVMFTGDQLAVRRLISVLADNAVKYSQKDGDIKMSLSAVKKGIKIVSENTCEPIEPAELKRLFDRFYRVDKSRSRSTGGYGIGLSIAAGVCESHGGTINAECPQEGLIRFTALLYNRKRKNQDNLTDGA